MRLTTKGRYGVRALVNLASTYANRPVAIKQIAKEEKISPEFLEQIFYLLKKNGIISSIRGPGGGFVLSKSTSEVSIKDILDAVGESTAPAPCAEKNSNGICALKKICMLADIWQDFSDLIDTFLSRITIKDIVEKGGKKLSESVDSDHDFSI